MPAHISHAVFGETVLRLAGRKADHPAWFLLGCQGPDLFLHNQRTKPSSLMWGRRIHRSMYGDYTAQLCSTLSDFSLGWNSPLGCYTAGFITHAVLDRETHPYITYISGWSPENRFFHPLCERMLDTALCRELGLPLPGTVSFHNRVYLGETAPGELVSLHSRALDTITAESRNRYSPSEIALRVSNAYDDTMHFLKKTDRIDASLRKNIAAVEDNHYRRYLIAVTHPQEIPAYLDVLNSRRNVWQHPWLPQNRSNEGFIDLFFRGAEKAASLLIHIWNTTASSASAPLRMDSAAEEETVRSVGNESLYSGLPDIKGLNPQVCRPLAFERYFEEMTDSRAVCF
jgi:hypothetical protein